MSDNESIKNRHDNDALDSLSKFHDQYTHLEDVLKFKSGVSK